MLMFCNINKTCNCLVFQSDKMNNSPAILLFDRNTIRHLRFPFSFFLLPVFLFALSQSANINWFHAALAFFILHFLVFPSSNGYNSYQDRDESSIGGLKYPPRVSENLFRVTLLFDVTALLLALVISPLFSLMILVFVTMSRLYSYRGIRLKKYPVTGFLTVFIFQGAFVFLMTIVAVHAVPVENLFSAQNLICMAVSSLFIGSMYPLTQIYQHEADKKDGVISISYLLGYHGTFIFSAGLFASATALLLFYFITRGQPVVPLLFFLFILPVVVFLSKWFGQVRKSSSYANFENTMRANLLSSVCMNLFFLTLIINNRILIF
jgi:1,4-dihydroxy-2-naphthoate polyprenyltransferase